MALAGLAAPAGAQAVGSEFQVNTYTTSNQHSSSGTADANGNYVVVWRGAGQGDGSGIFGQRFDSTGGALGGEFRVNSYTTGIQWYPSVASDASGDFVVVWTKGPNMGVQDVFGQRYDSGGDPLGTEFRVNSYTTGDQAASSVASDASGNFVVVWRSFPQDGSGWGVFGQRYDSTGVALGAEFRVNSYTPDNQWEPFVASDASGNFVVVWNGPVNDIFGQRFDSGGVALGAEFRVNSYTTFNQQRPFVASDPSGNFVVVWHGFGEDDNLGIFGQRYDSAGVAQGAQFQVNTYTTYAQRYPSVALDARGNFVVVWESGILDSPGQDGSGYGVFGQRYDSTGAAQGDEFQVNTFTTNFQRIPSVAATATDRFVVTWNSSGQDGNALGVFGQRFDFSGTHTITVVSPNTNVRWRIGSLQKIQWMHTLGPGASFRIELDRDDDGSYEELIADDLAVDSATRGSFAWTVTGPVAMAARVRVSWTDDPVVADSSDVTFQIRPAALDAER